MSEPPFIEAGDLADIEIRGQLRILYPRQVQTAHLPRKGYIQDFERELAGDYARQQGLEPVWIYVESREELIPSLLEGKGDFIAANMTATDERRQMVSFSVPIAVVREQVVTRSDDSTLTVFADLVGRRVALRRSSSFWTTMEALQQQYPGLELQAVPEVVDTEEIINRVGTGRYDVTVADSNVVEACMDYRDDIRAAFDVTGDRAIAWAVRPDSIDLLQSLDHYLSAYNLTTRAQLHVDDLPQIKERAVLRVLTRNAAATYFLWRGQLLGFEYELAKRFADKQGLRLEIVVPPDAESMLPWLREGRGDIVAAALTPTEERMKGGVVFAQPYNHVSQVVVTRTDDEIEDVDDLAGRTFHVRRSSAYWDTLAGLREDGVALQLEAAPEAMETEEIIAKVAAGEYDVTLADSHVLDIELTWREDVKGAFPLVEGIALAWAVRESNPELKAAVDTFVREEYHGLFYNVAYERYFRDPKKIRSHVEYRVHDNIGLSPYDDIVRRYAEQYGFDWRLIVAQMYQESRFNPTAQSFAGAQGLMQVLPRTAEELGFKNLHDPEVAIHAGVRYLDWCRDRFEPDLPVRDRMWFSLAAYNAGPGHVRDARRLASSLGLNPNRWFDNVEQAMLLLSRSQYARAAQHGYCRCREPVDYVRTISMRYGAYVDGVKS